MSEDPKPTGMMEEDNSTRAPIETLEDITAQEGEVEQSLDPDLVIQYSDQEDAAQSVTQSDLNEAELAELDIDQSEVDAATQGAIVGSITGASRNERERQRKLRKLAQAETGRKVAGGRRKKQEAKEGVYEQTEQAYLIQNLEKFLLAETTPESESMKNLIIANSKGNLINTLTIGNRLLPLMGISPEQLSSLIPYIRFFKSTKEGNERNLEEFKFSTTSPNMKEYFESGANQQKNVGLKSFSWESTGDNSYNSRRSFLADIVITFSSMSDLQAPDQGISWMDLILNNPTKTELEGEPKSESKFKRYEILAEIGYNFPDNAPGFTPELKASIRESRVFLSLYANTTEFDFKDDGSIELKVSYTASGEFLSNQFSSNILTIGTMSEELKLDAEKERLKKLTEDVADAPNKSKKKKSLEEQIKDLEVSIEEKTQRNRASNYAKFLQHLVTHQRLFTFTVTESQYKKGILPNNKELDRLLQEAPDADVVQDTVKELKKKEEAGKNLDKKPTPTGKRTISYFYLGDLMNYMAESLKEKPGEESSMASEVIIGDYEFYIFPPYDPKKKLATKAIVSEEVKKMRANLSTLPISLDMYNLFMYENAMKEGRDTWTFFDFVKKVTSELVDNAVNSYVKNRINDEAKKSFTFGKPSIKSTVTSGYSKALIGVKGGCPATINTPGTDFRIAPPETLEPTSTKFIPPNNFFIIYGARVPASIRRGTDEQVNAQNGVYHLVTGADRGIVKGIKFKQKANRLRDQNILKSRDTGNVDVGVLKLPYNATVEIMGTSPFYPGQALFISPALVGVGTLDSRKSIAKKLGLGGFYIVHKVSSDISMGILQSTVECNWETFPTPDQQTLDDKEADDATLDPLSNDCFANRAIKEDNINFSGESP